MNEAHREELAKLVDSSSEPNPLRRRFSPFLIVVFVICGAVAVFAGNEVVAVLAMLGVITPAITIGRESVKAEVRELLRRAEHD